VLQCVAVLNVADSDAGGVAPMDAAGAEFIWQ